MTNFRILLRRFVYHLALASAAWVCTLIIAESLLPNFAVLYVDLVDLALVVIGISAIATLVAPPTSSPRARRASLTLTLIVCTSVAISASSLLRLSQRADLALFLVFLAIMVLFLYAVYVDEASL